MIGFKQALETRLLALATAATGPTSGLSAFAKTYDDHLENLPIEQLPYVVAFAADKERDPDGQEISKYGNWIWHCFIYYLDTTQANEVWDSGKDRRDMIVGALEKSLEGNHFLVDAAHTLQPLRDVDPVDGREEKVWQTEITNVTFDQSGQPGYYTFVSELYLSVYTAKN